MRVILAVLLAAMAFGMDCFLWLLKRIKKICVFPGG